MNVPACRTWLRRGARGCLAALVLLFGVSCSGPEVVVLDPLPTITPRRTPTGDSPVRVYFSQPAGQSFRGGPDQHLVEAVDSARFEVLVAAYDLDLWSVRDALIRAHRRGVAVRVVTEGDHLMEEEIQDLVAAGIPVVADRGAGLMHQKFIVLDGSQVWTGTMNFTLNGAYRHDNLLVMIPSRELAENYRVEFEEMFQHRLFGDDILSRTPHPLVEVDGVRVENYFSPDDGVQGAIREVLDGAVVEIDVLAFSFTSNPLAEVLLDRADQGVKVRGVFDRSQAYSQSGSEFETLMEAGLDVCLDGGKDSMHHKVIIVDHRVVILGSYNFTFSAENRNDENVLIIHDPRLAELVRGEFQRLHDRCR